PRRKSVTPRTTSCRYHSSSSGLSKAVACCAAWLNRADARCRSWSAATRTARGACWTASATSPGLPFGATPTKPHTFTPASTAADLLGLTLPGRMMATLRMATTEHPAAGPLAVRAYADPIASGHRAELGSKAYSLQLISLGWC